LDRVEPNPSDFIGLSDKMHQNYPCVCWSI